MLYLCETFRAHLRKVQIGICFRRAHIVLEVVVTKQEKDGNECLLDLSINLCEDVDLERGATSAT